MLKQNGCLEILINMLRRQDICDMIINVCEVLWLLAGLEGSLG